MPRGISIAIILLFAGCSVLPEKNFVGMTREQLITSIAESGKTANDEFYICIKSGFHYFKTVEEIHQSVPVKNADEIELFFTPCLCGRRFFYHVSLKNDIVITQSVSYMGDGVYLTPRWFHAEYWK